MSGTEMIDQPRIQSSFASRLLTKELNLRKKTKPEIKFSPADAANHATAEVAEVKETTTVR
jgi:hypothetical protein